MFGSFVRSVLVAAAALLLAAFVFLQVAFAWTSIPGSIFSGTADFESACGITDGIYAEDGDVVTTSKWNELVCAVYTIYADVQTNESSITQNASDIANIGWEDVNLYGTEDFDVSCLYRFTSSGDTDGHDFLPGGYIFIALAHPEQLLYPDDDGWTGYVHDTNKVIMDTAPDVRADIYISNLQRLCLGNL